MKSTAPSQDIVAATWPTSPKSLPRVAIAGERNSGKTSLANRVLGEPLLPTSFITRTWLPMIVQYGDQTQLLLQRRNGRHVAASWHDVTGGAAGGRKLILSTPLQRLKHLRIVDTPACAGDPGEDRSTRCECERADVVLWCTSAVQAWKGSERDYWLSLPLRVRAKSILVVTFADLLGRQQDVTRILERLRAEANYFTAIVLASEIDDVIALGAQRVARVMRHSRRSDRQVADTPVLAAV